MCHLPLPRGAGDQQPQGFSRNGLDLSFDLLASHSVTPAAWLTQGQELLLQVAIFMALLHHSSDADGVLKEKLLQSF